MKSIGQIDQYVKLLVHNEDLLITRILHYIKKHDHSEFSLTSHDSWHLSVRGITESLILAAKNIRTLSPKLNPDADTGNDPILHYGMLQVQKLRQKGIKLGKFLELLNYYQLSFNDLTYSSCYSEEEKKCFRFFTERCFRRMETGYVKAWNNTFSINNLEEAPRTNAVIDDNSNDYLIVFESLVTPIILTDANNKIINFNLSASKLFADLKVNILPGTENSFSSWSFKSIQNKVEELIESSLDELNFESSFETDQGTRYFQILLNKIIDANNKLKGVVIMIEDRTERNDTEKSMQLAKNRAEETDRLKTAFLVNMSHEIRTPMNAIIGFTELMLNGKFADEERKDYLKLIRKSSNDLLNIIEDVIDIAKIESQQLRIKYKICNPYELIHDLKTVFQETLRRYGTNQKVKLLVDVDENEKKFLFYIDDERLKQVVSNLLNNAAKYTNKGFIKFGYKRVDQSNLLFFVRDSGIGIPEKMRERIFERFVQLDQDGENAMGGAGLGLAISKNIINLLGGKLWVESVEGKGSDFFFQLPIKEVPKNIKHTINDKDDQNLDFESDWSNKRILIAEDDQINFQYLKEVISKSGAEILWARSGIEAINIAEVEEKLDLILMDIKMPEIDGIQATRYIKKIRPQVPVIAQTAYAMENDRIKCLNAGCSAYIPKPIDQKKLFLLIEKFLLAGSKTLKHIPTIK
ncbi:Sensor histidine kinase RcsC [subsurface metagenome]